MSDKHQFDVLADSVANYIRALASVKRDFGSATRWRAIAALTSFGSQFAPMGLPIDPRNGCARSFAFAIDPVVVVLGRRWIEFPAPAVSLFYFLG
jgi:hypothetical protein